MHRPQIKTADLIGRRIGRLLVVRLDGTDQRGHRNVRCVCDCGTQRSFKARCLVHGMTRSCGCLRDEVGAKNLGAWAVKGGCS